jgi:hypothetical protein
MNSFNTDGDVNCGTTSEPCIEWPQDVTVDIAFSSTLDSECASCDMKYYVKGAAGKWNGISDARNPTLSELVATAGADIFVTTADLGSTYYAYTTRYYGTPTKCSTCTRYKAIISEARIEFNSRTSWNVSGTWGNPDGGGGDVRTAALHEWGHSEGLGHTTVSSAVMYRYLNISRQTVIQNDDINGIRAVYQ